MDRKLGQCLLLAAVFACGNALALVGRAQDTSAGSRKIETVGTIPSSGYTEGLCQTADGTVYVTGIDEQVFWKVRPNGQVEKFASTPAHIMVPLVTKDGFIATARKGAAPRTPLAGGIGVEPGSAVHIDFSVDVGTEILVIDKTGKVTDTVPGPKGSYFNGIAYAGHGFYVIADSGSPIIWRLDLAKKQIESWLKDDQLSSPVDARPNNIAGNGIKVHDGWVYVAVTSRNAIYRVQMDSKGRPRGPLTIFAQGFRPDDFDIAKDGTIYLPSGTSLFKISPTGEVSKFLDGAGLSAATRISLDGKWVYWPTRGGTEPQRLLRVAIP
jgi:sugar lactone lactonase YvrE